MFENTKQMSKISYVKNQGLWREDRKMEGKEVKGWKTGRGRWDKSGHGKTTREEDWLLLLLSPGLFLQKTFRRSKGERTLCARQESTWAGEDTQSLHKKRGNPWEKHFLEVINQTSERSWESRRWDWEKPKTDRHKQIWDGVQLIHRFLKGKTRRFWNLIKKNWAGLAIVNINQLMLDKSVSHSRNNWICRRINGSTLNQSLLRCIPQNVITHLYSQMDCAKINEFCTCKPF